MPQDHIIRTPTIITFYICLPFRGNERVFGSLSKQRPTDSDPIPEKNIELRLSVNWAFNRRFSRLEAVLPVIKLVWRSNDATGVLITCDNSSSQPPLHQQPTKRTQ